MLHVEVCRGVMCCPWWDRTRGTPRRKKRASGPRCRRKLIRLVTQRPGHVFCRLPRTRRIDIRVRTDLTHLEHVGRNVTVNGPTGSCSVAGCTEGIMASVWRTPGVPNAGPTLVSATCIVVKCTSIVLGLSASWNDEINLRTEGLLIVTAASVVKEGVDAVS